MPNTPLVNRRVAPKGVKSLYDDDYHFDTSWREEASCREKDLNLFFPAASETKSVAAAAQALRICYHCPVSHFCLYEAMKYNYDGIWGNTIYKQRIHLIRTELDNNLENLTLQNAREFVKITKIENLPMVTRALNRRRLTPKDVADELS